MPHNKEIEVRFIPQDIQTVKDLLLKLGAEDFGEDLLTEVACYDKELLWVKNRKEIAQVVRVRKTSKDVTLTYKRHEQNTKNSEAVEIELHVDDFEKAKALVEAIGLTIYRTQQKRRHKFQLGEVIIDFDTWPQCPTYLELEGPSEELLKETAAKLGLNWQDAIYENAGNLVEKYFKIPVGNMHWFTFDRFELPDDKKLLI